jgi:hypothetical protein
MLLSVAHLAEYATEYFIYVAHQAKCATKRLNSVAHVILCVAEIAKPIIGPGRGGAHHVSVAHVCLMRHKNTSF